MNEDDFSRQCDICEGAGWISEPPLPGQLLHPCAVCNGTGERPLHELLDFEHGQRIIRRLLVGDW